MPIVVNKIQDFSSSVSGNAVSGVNNVLIPLSAEPETNFDVTANWSLASVTDQASFEAFLTSQGATSVTITYFDLTAGRLKVYMSVEGLSVLTIVSIGVVVVNKINGFDNSLTEIYLDQNQIEIFDPIDALPSNLQILNLDNNLIVDFDPSISLPLSLLFLGLSYNLIVDFDPSISLPSNLQILTLASNLIVDFNPSISLPSNLQGLLLDSNQIVYFNPSTSLPITLEGLSLIDNLMTTAGYIVSESWATAQPSFTNTCEISFGNNIDSVTGSNLETILLTKNATINP